MSASRIDALFWFPNENPSVRDAMALRPSGNCPDLILWLRAASWWVTKTPRPSEGDEGCSRGEPRKTPFLFFLMRARLLSRGACCVEIPAQVRCAFPSSLQTEMCAGKQSLSGRNWGSVLLRRRAPVSWTPQALLGGQIVDCRWLVCY